MALCQVCSLWLILYTWRMGKYLFLHVRKRSTNLWNEWNCWNSVRLVEEWPSLNLRVFSFLVDDRWKKYHEEESVNHEWWLHKFKLLRNNSIKIREQRQTYRKVSKPNWWSDKGPDRRVKNSEDGQFGNQSILLHLKT